jgi:hypothetical protein
MRPLFSVDLLALFSLCLRAASTHSGKFMACIPKKGLFPMKVIFRFRFVQAIG